MSSHPSVWLELPPNRTRLEPILFIDPSANLLHLVKIFFAQHSQQIFVEKYQQIFPSTTLQTSNLKARSIWPKYLFNSANNSTRYQLPPALAGKFHFPEKFPYSSFSVCLVQFYYDHSIFNADEICGPNTKFVFLF